MTMPPAAETEGKGHQCRPKFDAGAMCWHHPAQAGALERWLNHDIWPDTPQGELDLAKGISIWIRDRRLPTLLRIAGGLDHPDAMTRYLARCLLTLNRALFFQESER